MGGGNHGDRISILGLLNELSALRYDPLVAQIHIPVSDLQSSRVFSPIDLTVLPTYFRDPFSRSSYQVASKAQVPSSGEVLGRLEKIEGRPREERGPNN